MEKKDFKDKEFSLKKIGGTQFLAVPYEYIRVYEIDKNLYNLTVTNNGNVLTYKKCREINTQEENDNKIKEEQKVNDRNEREIDENIKSLKEFDENNTIRVENCEEPKMEEEDDIAIPAW